MQQVLLEIARMTVSFMTINMIEYQLISYVSGEKSKRSFFILMYLGLSTVFGGVLYLTASWPIVVMILFNAVVNTIPSLFLHRYIFKTIDIRVIFFFGMISSMLCLVLSIWTLKLVNFIAPGVGGSTRSLLTNGILFFSISLIYYLLSKTNVYFVLRKILEYPRMALIIALVMTFMNCFIEVFGYGFIGDDFSAVYIGLYTLYYCLIFVVYLFLFREFLRDKRLKESEALILQQQSYMNRLEGIQLDLRKIHHDYKNVATGLYAQIENGDLKAAQEFISQKMLKMDQEIQVNVQQMNQLTNIEVIELKTLIMAKIMQAEKFGVLLTVEVMVPIKTIPMEISDMLRCGGILMDNAIEAAAKEQRPQVSIVLLKENNRLTLIVKNPISQKVDLQRIWSADYSTKGEKRGLGLVNLKEIIRRYPDIWLETRVEKKEFIQMMNFKIS